MESLKWIFQLYDGVSGPAKGIEGALGGIEKSLQGLPGSIAMAQEGFQGLISAAQGLASVVIDSGKFAINALAFKESTLASFELMMGTKEAAKEMFAQANTIANLTPFKAQDVIKSFKDLMQAGFKKEEVPIVFSAVGDVAAGQGFSTEIMDRLTQNMGEIKAKGVMDAVDFKQFSRAGAGGQPLLDAIANIMHVKSSDVHDLISQGKVTADITIAAVLDSIKKRYSGKGELGQGMLTQGETLSGLFSTIGDTASALFTTIDLDSSKGFQGLKKFVQMVRDTLDPTSKTFGKLQSVVTGVLDSIGGAIGAISLDTLLGAFDKFVSFVQTGVAGVTAFKDSVMTILGPTFDLMTLMGDGEGRSEGFINAMKVLGYLLGGILNVVLLLGMGIAKAFEGFKMIGDIDWGYLVDQMKDFGVDLLKGLADGILSAVSMPVQAIISGGKATIDAFKSVLDINSPSGVFEELGAFTAQGFADGVTAARGEVDSAVGNMVQVPSVYGGGRASPVVNLTVQVDGAGADAETLARRLADLLPSQLASAFEQLAIEGGAA